MNLEMWPWIQELHDVAMATTNTEDFDFFHAWWCSLSGYTDRFYFGGY